MAFPKLNFTKSWKNAVDFPTVETNETKVRADMQYLFDELKEALNGIVDKLNGKKLDDYPSGGVVTTLGTDHTTVPTSKAVRDAMNPVSYTHLAMRRSSGGWRSSTSGGSCSTGTLLRRR